VNDIAHVLRRQAAEVLGWWDQHGNAAVGVFDRARRSALEHVFTENRGVVITARQKAVGSAVVDD
jgi:hypothetical protein